MSQQLEDLRGWTPKAPARIASRLATPSIAVASGKGGVGKSHVSLSVGLALAERGKKVLLVDGDMGLANLHILCGKHPDFDLSDVLAGRCEIGQAILPLAERIDLLPAASGVAELSAMPREKMEAMAESLSTLHARYDVLVVDTGAGIGETTLNLSMACDRCLLVTTPDPTAQADAYAFLKVVRSRRGDLPLSLVVNMADSETQARDVAARLGQVASRFLKAELPFLGSLPRQPGIEAWLLRRTPVYQGDHEGPFSKAIRSLAHRLEPLTPQAPLRQGFFSRLGGVVE